MTKQRLFTLGCSLVLFLHCHQRDVVDLPPDEGGIPVMDPEPEPIPSEPTPPPSMMTESAAEPLTDEDRATLLVQARSVLDNPTVERINALGDEHVATQDEETAIVLYWAGLMEVQRTGKYPVELNALEPLMGNVMHQWPSLAGAMHSSLGKSRQALGGRSTASTPEPCNGKCTKPEGGCDAECEGSLKDTLQIVGSCVSGSLGFAKAFGPGVVTGPSPEDLKTLSGLWSKYTDIYTVGTVPADMVQDFQNRGPNTLALIKSASHIVGGIVSALQLALVSSNAELTPQGLGALALVSAINTLVQCTTDLYEQYHSTMNCRSWKDDPDNHCDRCEASGIWTFECHRTGSCSGAVGVPARLRIYASDLEPTGGVLFGKLEADFVDDDGVTYPRGQGTVYPYESFDPASCTLGGFYSFASGEPCPRSALSWPSFRFGSVVLDPLCITDLGLCPESCTLRRVDSDPNTPDPMSFPPECHQASCLGDL